MRGPLLSRIGELPMTAIADQMHDELATTIGITSGGSTKGVPTPLRDAPIHLQTHADKTKGAASRGAIGEASRRIGKIAARGVTNNGTIGHRIRTLCWRLRTARSGEPIANRRAETPATGAGHPESKSN